MTNQEAPASAPDDTTAHAPKINQRVSKKWVAGVIGGLLALALSFFIGMAYENHRIQSAFEDAFAGIGEEAQDDPSDEAAAELEQLPFDGGTYTWSSGITLTTSVEKVEPWGSTDDFCGDGTCGVADPDDTRFVLRYEVSVPADHSGPFDASSCPGSLHVMSGNDDEAFSSVAGDYYAGLDGDVLPGATKFGVEEYYIEKTSIDQDFYLASDCGDVDYDGETAYFGGTIAG